MGGDKKSGRVYPHVWKHGPDPFVHEVHIGYLKAKAQAQFRKEEWLLEFEDYFKMWKDDWNNRGRGADNVCMTRKDPEGPWDTNNAYIITRKEHLAEQGRQRSGKSIRYKTRYTKMKVNK